MCATPASDRVLHTAIDLFYRHGIRAVGVNTVVADSGVAKMTLYKHFPSKDALVVAALEQQDREWRAWFEAEVVARGDGPLERLLGAFDVIGAWVEETDFRGCAFINAAVELRNDSHPGHEAARAHKRWLRELLLALVREGGLRKPEETADALLLLLEGAIIGAQVGVAAAPAATAKEVARVLIAARRPAAERLRAG